MFIKIKFIINVLILLSIIKIKIDCIKQHYFYFQILKALNELPTTLSNARSQDNSFVTHGECSFLVSNKSLRLNF